MRILQRLVSFIVVLSCICAHATTLVFDKYVEIRNERILLGDIARIQNAGTDELALAAIDLGKAPAVGRLEKLEAAQILRWINHRHPQFQNLVTQGASILHIKTVAGVIPLEDLKLKAKDALSWTFANDQWELITSPRSTEIIVPDRAYQLIVRTIQPTKQCERVMVKIDAVSNDNVLASKVLWFSRVKAGRDEEIISRVVENENTKSTELRYCKNSCDCIWQVENRTLTPHKYKEVSDVTRLEEVVIEMRDTSFVIETKGIALASAKKGEKVRVKRIGSTDSFIATVTDVGRVQVVEGVKQ